MYDFFLRSYLHARHTSWNPSQSTQHRTRKSPQAILAVMSAVSRVKHNPSRISRSSSTTVRHQKESPSPVSSPEHTTTKAFPTSYYLVVFARKIGWYTFICDQILDIHFYTVSIYIFISVVFSSTTNNATTAQFQTRTIIFFAARLK